VNQTLYVSFVILGPLLTAYGAGLLITGRNYSSPLGRGLTRGDTARLQRAPAIYFRAIGAMVGTGGLALLNYGVLMSFQSSLPPVLVTILEILEFLLYAALLVSALWLLRLANRYKLFRWNKP
jgi:hypothetical protein